MNNDKPLIDFGIEAVKDYKGLVTKTQLVEFWDYTTTLVVIYNNSAYNKLLHEVRN